MKLANLAKYGGFMERITDEFVVQAESGQTFTIQEFTNFVSAGHRDNPKATVPGMKRLMVTNGMHVNFKEDGLYEIMELGIIARRVKGK